MKSSQTASYHDQILMPQSAISSGLTALCHVNIVHSKQYLLLYCMHFSLDHKDLKRKRMGNYCILIVYLPKSAISNQTPCYSRSSLGPQLKWDYANVMLIINSLFKFSDQPSSQNPTLLMHSSSFCIYQS